jgi:O-antigen biosynthesis alpha-1,2-rhamnosyltransferase
MDDRKRTEQDPSERRVWLECTSTHSSRYNTGIQRATKSLIDASKDLSPECVPIMYNGRFFEAIDGLPGVATASGRTATDVLRRSFHAARSIVLRAAPGARGALHSRQVEYTLRRLVHATYNARRWLSSLRVPIRRRVRFRSGDVLVLLDPSWSIDLSRELNRARREGAEIWMVVNDLIPLQHPDLAPEGSPILMEKWLRRVVPLVNGALGISRTVAADLRARLQAMRLGNGVAVDYFYLGAGLGAIKAEEGEVATAAEIFADGGRVYLMVGTVEPRKNHVVVIDAFEQLWKTGSKAKLLVFGRLGWRSDDLAKRLTNHPERGRRLVWLDAGTDAELDFAYRRATALLFPSLCEGFGLPLVEAMSYGLPVIASDIAVFREIGGAYPRYVDVSAAGALELAIRERETEWENELENKLGQEGPARRQPRAWISWRESADMLLAKVTGVRG